MYIVQKYDLIIWEMHMCTKVQTYMHTNVHSTKVRPDYIGDAYVYKSTNIHTYKCTLYKRVAKLSGKVPLAPILS